MDLVATAAEQRTGYRPDIRQVRRVLTDSRAGTAAPGWGPRGSDKRRWREPAPEARLVHLSIGDAACILMD